MRTTSGYAFVAILLLSGCVRYETTAEVSAANASPIVFDVPVPEGPTELPVYELRPNPIKGRVEEMVAICPDPKRQKAGGMQDSSAVKGGEKPARQCHVDYETGEVEIYPDLQKLADSPRQSQLAVKGVEDFKHFLLDSAEKSGAGIVDTETAPYVHGVRVLMHARLRQSAADASSNLEPAPMMMYVTARRRVGEYRVDGPGSRAAMLLAADGTEQGFTRSWKRATRGRDVSAPSTQQVRAQIEQQLLAMNPQARVHVQRVEIAYYDSDRTLLQPVYRFVAELPAEDGAIGTTDHVVGYVPFSTSDDPVPRLDAEHFPERSAHAAASAAAGAPVGPAVTVGRYIARNDSKGWIADAEAFWRAIETNSDQVQFVDSQVLPASEEQFTTESLKFVDSVEIALVEAHGAPWQFATERNCCKRVHIGRPGSPSFSYGPGGGGKLKHWILHSCDVMRSPAETAHWADRWWGVFKNGLYSVVGYRSSMYISDGAGAAMGRRLAQGEPVLSAWFSTVATLNAYGLNPSAKFGCNHREDVGRPAAISACGAAMARAGETANITSDCLDAWWIKDGLARPESQQGRM